jgi:hypothetical protein
METTSGDDLIIVREVLAREIETINFYQTLGARANSDEVRDSLSHITDEEKEHVAEALALIKVMDPVQARFLETGHLPRHDKAAPAPAPAVEAARPEPAAGFTVGSLRRPRE